MPPKNLHRAWRLIRGHPLPSPVCSGDRLHYPPYDTKREIVWNKFELNSIWNASKHLHDNYNDNYLSVLTFKGFIKAVCYFQSRVRHCVIPTLVSVGLKVFPYSWEVCRTATVPKQSPATLFHLSAASPWATTVRMSSVASATDT